MPSLTETTMHAQPLPVARQFRCELQSFEAPHLLSNLFRMQNTSKQKRKEIQHDIKCIFFFVTCI